VPIRFDIDMDKRWIQTTASGRVRYADLIDYYHRLRSHPDFADDLSIIFDTTPSEGFDLDFDDVSRLSTVNEQFTQLDPPLNVAIVAPGDLAFGLSRMYETLKNASPSSVKVFRDRAAAEAWVSTRARDAASH